MRSTHAALFTALTLAGSGGSLPAAEKITYDDHILPLFQQSCLNCHNPDKSKGGLDLSTYSGAMKGSSGGKIAEPGDAGSKLIAVVMHTAEPAMPPEGDKLGGAQMKLLQSWIEGGLLENKGSTARKVSKPKFDTALTTAGNARPEGPPPMPRHVLLDPPVLSARASSVHAMVASPWAPLLAVTGQRQVLLYDVHSLELAGILPFPEGDPVALAFTPNARYLIVGGGVPGKSGITVTFDVVTGERMLVAAKEFDSVLATDLRPDLSMIATGSPSRLIKIWNPEDGSQVHSIKKHSDWVTALDFSPDGILLATGDRNGGVWVWEADGASEFHTLRAHQAAITALSFRADSNLLASASEDGSVRFWEMNGGGEVRKLDAHAGGVLAFAWARDGSFITSGRDRTVKLWKADFSLSREIKDQADLPVAVAIDSEGARAFAADYRGRITAWEIAGGNAVGGFDANPPSIAQRLVSLREEILKQPENAALKASERRWTAAGLNAEAMKIRAEADQHDPEAEALIADFGALAKSVETQSAAIATAHHAVKELQTLADAESALAAAHKALAALEAGLATSSKNLADAKAKAESSLATVHTLRNQADVLKSRYHILHPESSANIKAPQDAR
ncbi:MAG: c-type cytochrome domain-containing protein [Luteolibacter sp.]|jgi:mono/diheme cytochrome c family protein|nr:c-type cytochrome domain-containing protein [Luteolibacter sp.]